MVTEEEIIERNENPKKSVAIASLDELALFAEKFLTKIQGEYVAGAKGEAKSTDMDGGNFDKAVVVGLSGDLGAGKTTFSQCVAKALGIEEVVNSPTFVIQKNYETKDPIFKHFAHIDAYRLENGEEIEKLRFKELLATPGTLVFIEWPEKVAEILPKDTIMLSFESIDENTRKISY